MGDGDAEKNSKFCCPVKEFYSNEKNLISTLEITPRNIIINKSLKPRNVYSQTIQVKNKGLFNRSLKYRTDSEDTEIKMHGLSRIQYLPPNATVYVEIIICAQTKKDINRQRHLYIDAEHPSVTFEIPIIVLPRSAGPIYPNEIEFPRSLPKSKTYYELTVYNAAADEVNFNIRPYTTALTVNTDSTKIKPKECARVLLRLKVKDFCPSQGFFKMRFGACILPVTFTHKPKKFSFYLSQPIIKFEETRFERSTVKSFTVCNETETSVPYSFEFQPGYRSLSINLQENIEHDGGDISPDNESPGSGSSAVSIEEDESLSKLFKTTERILRTFRKSDFKNFRLEPKQGEFGPNSCTRITATFNPRINVADYETVLTPPFPAETDIKLVIPNSEDYENSIVASGLIDGPEVFISPKAIDFRQVYLGEEHCEQIRITNTDGVVDCQVDYYDYSGTEMAKVFVSPKTGLFLQPCEQDVFTFTFYTTIIGKIYLKLRFKVKNGKFLIVIVRADSQPVRVKSFPELVEFGSVPFGVPQKRQVLLMNPLSVPLSLQCFVVDNGTETPLVLNVDNVQELPPVDIKNPIGNIIDMQNEDKISAYNEDDLLSRCSSEVTSFHSMSTGHESICSSAFQNQVIEPIEDLALKIVNNIKTKRIPEKNEPEAKILREAANQLLALPYFADLTRYNNYACMDWDAIPSDPCELYFDAEIIHLKPNSGRSLAVLIVPNTVGYFNRAIHIRCCPHVQINENEDFDPENPDELVCDSSLLITKLYVEYNCRVPHIKWENQISFPDGEIYAMQINNFEMEFENQSNIGGFLHFVLVPNCEKGVMRFRHNCWKFFITAEDCVYAYCTVEFKRTGNVTLTGMLKIVGQSLGIPFHLSANVLPTRVLIQPTSIYKRQSVLETTFVTIFITNLTPTVTGFILSLRDDSHHSLDTYGAQLGPNGQGTYVSIRTMYRDPDVYQNKLYVDMLYGKKLEIPLTFNVVGMPIFFDPDLKKDFDAGTIILSSEKEYEGRNTNYSQIVRIWNEGERPYSVTFQKIKGNTDITMGCSCSAESLRAQFFINPRTVYLLPGGVAYIEITAVGCQEAMVYSEFRVTIIDQNDSTRFMNLRFVLKGKFAQPELVWNPKGLHMTYNKTHKYLEHPQMEIVQLINNCNAPVKNVRLDACGPFKIRELFEHPFTKRLVVNFEPLEHKEFTILLLKKQLEKENLRRYPIIKGYINIHVHNSTHKAFPIILKINLPDIVIVESEIVLFTGLKEDFTEILIENIGLLEAYYKWKKLGESEKFVAEIDDAYKFAQDLLHDLLLMLELHENYDFGDDPLCHENLTSCYKKYRCIINDTPYFDPIGVVDIIDGIIANLDLEHKRYKICLDEPEDDVLSEQSTFGEVPSAERNVKKTIDTIVDHLKLEDTYSVSEPSEEECDKKGHIYFCMKDGVVLSKHGVKCLLHLPPVKEGYAVTAEFELDVIGGNPQNLKVTIVNLERIIQLIPESYYLGVKPWYELCMGSIAISNSTPYRISIEVLNPTEVKRDNFHLVNGYAEVTSAKIFFMKPYCMCRIRTEGIMGFTDEFIRDIKLRICDRQINSFRLRGQGVMPILLATGCKKYPRIEQTREEIVEEYRALQKIFYFTMFRDSTCIDEDMELVCPGEEEGTVMPGYISDFDEDEECSTRTSKMLRIEKDWQNILCAYVIGYNDTSLPNAVILEQLIHTVKFKERLIANSETRDILKLVFRDYIKMLCTYDERMPLNLKYFTVQPLPYKQLGYIAEMTDLKLNQFRRYQIELQFFGPGKLTASARTAIHIPGLYVHFEVYERNSCDNFELYRAEEKMPDFYVRKYRNMWEREIDAEMDPKLHHAHSFDCERRCQFHKREILTMSAKTRKDINNYYNSLNKSIYLENKHHFINCTIFAKCKNNFSGTRLRIHILLRPDEKYFTEGQVFEDYLYIDLHLGPTLPILMRGLIK